MVRALKVGIIGGTIWGNRGAEAMLATTIGQVSRRHPGSDFRVFSYYPVRDRALLRTEGPKAEGLKTESPKPGTPKSERLAILDGRPISLVLRHFLPALPAALSRAVGLRWPERWLTCEARALRECDVLLDIGGITFVDGREIFLAFNILSLWPAMLLGVPVIKLAQAMGPFHSLANRLSARVFLGRCRKVYARGSVTAGHLSELALPEDIWVRSADIAFLYEDGFTLSDENAPRVARLEAKLQAARDSGRTIVAISPSVLVEEKSRKSRRDYLGDLLDLIVQQAAADPRTLFVVMPNATRQGSDAGKNNDLRAIALMKARAAEGLPEEVKDDVVWVDFDVNTQSIRRLLRPCDALISSRFHAMVAGLAMGIPTVVIGWSHKYAEVLADFGMDHLASDFGAADPGLGEVLREVLEMRRSIRSQILAALPEVRSLAERQFQQLGELLP